MSSFKDKYHSINFIKGIAIILVTYFHLWRSLGKRTFIIGSFDLTLPFHFRDLGVSLFIFISGFLVVSSLVKYKSFNEFMKKKFLNLSPLYFIAVIFYYIFAKAGYPIAELHDLNSVLLHLTFTHTLVDSTTYSLAGVLWYMGLIMQLYAVAYLIYKMDKKSKLISIFFVFAFAYLSYNLSHPIVNNRFFGKYILIFYLGMLSNTYYDRFKHLLKSKMFMLGYMIILIGYCFNSKVPGIIDFKYMDYSQGFIYIFFPLFLMMIEQFKDIKNLAFRIVSYLGEISYPLYLFNYSYIVISKSVKVQGLHGLVFYSIFLLIISVMVNELHKWIKKQFSIRSVREEIVHTQLYSSIEVAK